MNIYEGQVTFLFMFPRSLTILMRHIWFSGYRRYAVCTCSDDCDCQLVSCCWYTAFPFSFRKFRVVKTNENIMVSARTAVQWSLTFEESGEMNEL